MLTVPTSFVETHLHRRRVHRAGDFRLPIVVVTGVVVVSVVGFALVCFRHVYREGESEARDIGTLRLAITNCGEIIIRLLHVVVGESTRGVSARSLFCRFHGE